MDVTFKTVLLAQNPGGLDHLIHDAVLIPARAGAEEETFDVVRPVKREGNSHQLFWGVRERLTLAAAAGGVGAVAALMATMIGVKRLEDSPNTPSFSGSMLTAGPRESNLLSWAR